MNFLKLMAIDKWFHLFVGFIVAMVCTTLFNDVIVGICAAMCIGVVKEWIIDGWMKLGTFEAWDFYVTTIGGIIGSLVAYGLFLIGIIKL